MVPSRDVRLGATCAAMSSGVKESCSLILTIPSLILLGHVQEVR